MNAKNIKSRFFSKGRRCFIVAEISSNHGQDIKRAISLIKEAKKCGADAVKFQIYTPDALTVDSNNKYFMIKHPEWGGQTLYQLYEKACTPLSWCKKLKSVANDLGILFFSTAFDKNAIDFLEDVGVPFHKISSFELGDLELIEHAAKTGKPLILSTGMSTQGEIREAVGAARKAGAVEVILLKCVSSYPAKPQEMNLRTIPNMEKIFKCPIGLSDHTLGVGVPIAAVALGAMMIEKHFVHSRKDKALDSFFSIEPLELKLLVDSIRIAEASLGQVYYGLTKEEIKNRFFKRSLFSVKDIGKGESFTQDNVRSIRPYAGLEPKFFKNILNKKAKKKIKKGTPISWQLIKRNSARIP